MSRVLSILIYHSILETPDPLRPGDVDATTFQRQIRILSRLFNILPLSDAVESLRDQSLPPRAVCNGCGLSPELCANTAAHS